MPAMPSKLQEAECSSLLYRWAAGCQMALRLEGAWPQDRIEEEDRWGPTNLCTFPEVAPCAPTPLAVQPRLYLWWPLPYTQNASAFQHCKMRCMLSSTVLQLRVGKYFAPNAPLKASKSRRLHFKCQKHNHSCFVKTLVAPKPSICLRPFWYHWKPCFWGFRFWCHR